MSDVRQRGFTVIEVTLFLAITGLLFLIALIGTGSTIRSIRFTDSARSTTAFLQRQYDDIINGLNQRSGNEACLAGVIIPGSQPIGTSPCLLMGKLIIFEINSSQLTTYDIVGTEPSNPNYGLTDSALVTAFQPRVVTTIGTNTFDIPWEAYVSGTKRVIDNEGVTGLALIRSPKSSRILSYTYKVTNATVDSDLQPIVSASANLGREVNYCIKNADGQGLPAKIVINNGPNQQAVQLGFDADSGGNECNGI